MAQAPCPRTGLPTKECECTYLVSDLKAPITPEQKAYCIRTATERRERTDD